MDKDTTTLEYKLEVSYWEGGIEYNLKQSRTFYNDYITTALTMAQNTELMDLEKKAYSIIKNAKYRHVELEYTIVSTEGHYLSQGTTDKILRVIKQADDSIRILKLEEHYQQKLDCTHNDITIKEAVKEIKKVTKEFKDEIKYIVMLWLDGELNKDKVS